MTLVLACLFAIATLHFEGPGLMRDLELRNARLVPARDLKVENTSRRVIRVSSHFPFDRVNARLVFDRAAAAGFRLDLPAGSSERWSPGETRTVSLVQYNGPAAEPR